MNLQKVVVPIVGVIAVAVGWRAAGWGGVALVVGGIVMWMLLHFNRMTTVLKRAGSRPIGYCDSAVMLNARLRPRVNLLHVMALTNAMGEQLSQPGEQPEIFRWTDGTASSVTCQFRDGRLVSWELVRPAEPPESAPPAAP